MFICGGGLQLRDAASGFVHYICSHTHSSVYSEHSQTRKQKNESLPIVPERFHLMSAVCTISIKEQLLAVCAI